MGVLVAVVDLYVSCIFVIIIDADELTKQIRKTDTTKIRITPSIPFSFQRPLSPIISSSIPLTTLIEVDFPTRNRRSTARIIAERF